MKMGEAFRRATEKAPAFAVKSSMSEDFRHHIRGDVFISMHDGKTGELQEYRELLNLVVLDASILIARLMKNNVEPPRGVYCLAIGTGAPGWNPAFLLNPPAPVNTQRSLWSEIARKTFANTQFINSGGLPVAIPTNVVDYTTTFAEAEAVGPLMEMGLLCPLSTNMSVRNLIPNGAIGPYDPTVDTTTYDVFVNVLNFGVIVKPATSTLTIVWRITT